MNETLITASRDRVNIRMQDTPAYNRATYGINYEYLYAAKDLPTKLPAFDATGFSTYTGSPYPSNSSGPIYVFSNNTTKIVNTHTIKFGFLLERAGQNDYDQINVQGVPGGTDNQNGRFVFTDTTPDGTGLAIANAARGLFSTYAEIGQRSYTPYRGHMFETFINDSWKATDRLKIELGVRYSLIQPFYSLWRNMAVFDPTFYDQAKAVQVNRSNGNPIAVAGSDLYNGVVIPGGGWPISALGRIPYATTGEFDYLFRGVDKSYSQMQKNLFQPRVGIAYHRQFRQEGHPRRYWTILYPHRRFGLHLPGRQPPAPAAGVHSQWKSRHTWRRLGFELPAVGQHAGSDLPQPGGLELEHDI